MWKTAEELGLSESQINEIVEELYKKEKAIATRECPDCAVKVGEAHVDGCDVARCENCGHQALSCGCDNYGKDIWTGMWPGVDECYKRKLIATMGGSEWVFDLNTLSILKLKK